ncbi:MAG: ABC transporter permease [Actinomycetes bacterium]
MAENVSAGKRIQHWLRSEGARIWIAMIVLIIFCRIVAPGTLTSTALLAMLPVTAILAVSAVGQSLTIQQGGIDFAVPGAMTLAAIVVTGVPNGDESKLPLGIAIALVSVLIAGLLSGLAITWLNITPIIATLAVNALLIGAVLTYASASPKMATQALSSFTVNRTLGVPNTVWIALVFLVIAIVVQSRTVVGRRFVAVGASPAASRAMGLQVTRYLVGTYMIAALCYGVAGIMLAGYLVAPGPSLGTPYLLASITAVVIGGTSFGGGRARLAGTAVAALFLSMLNSLLSSLGAPTSTQLLVQSAAFAIAIGSGPGLAKLREVMRQRSMARAASQPAPAS